MSATEMVEEVGLRPGHLAEFVGQQELKNHLRIILGAARQRGQSPDHMLFAGPPGLGKTTLSGIIAAELGTELHVTTGPALEKAADLANMITKLGEGDVLFIDEIHRMPRAVEEILYSAMEDFAIDIVVGSGPTATSIRLPLPRFTLVGATTRTGLLTAPLRDRFGMLFNLDYYTVEELQAIVVRSAGVLGVRIDADAAHEVARRSRGTPRIANRLLRRVRDYAQMEGTGHVDAAMAVAGLELFGVDQLGLDKVDRALLKVLCAPQTMGRPVGLSTLAAAIGEAPDTVEEVYEPYLLRQGLIVRTSRGRQATTAAFRHLGLGQ